MARRKGELTSNTIDREWPHQIMMKEDDCCGARYAEVHGFANALSVCSRGHSFSHERHWYHVFCFKERADAETFQAIA